MAVAKSSVVPMVINLNGGYNQLTNILFDCMSRVQETLNMYLKI